MSHDWDALIKQLAKGKPAPAVKPTSLPLATIKLWPGAFQHRGPKAHESEAHVRELVAAIKRSNTHTLSPVEVWWDGRHWACVDGHHRLRAYGAASVGPNHPVPVEGFSGTLDEAMGRAALANTRDKLRMTRSEKSNAAWRLVSTTSMSKAATAAASGASESTVAVMRKTHALLRKRSDPEDALVGSCMGDLRDMTWISVKALAAGKEAADFDREAANEVKAQKMAISLARALGNEGAKYPEILARALDIYDSRLMDRLMECWGTQESEGNDEPDGAAMGF